MTRLRAGTFPVLVALVVVAAGVSVYLELKIRRTAAEIERLQRDPALQAAAGRAQPSRTANHAPVATVDPAPPARDERRWGLDYAQMEKEWKQAVAAMGRGNDLGIIRRASNQIRVRQRFHALYDLLGLSEAEIAVFEQEAADQNLTFNELVTPNPENVEPFRQSQAKLMDRIVESTLGRDYVEPFRAFLLTSDLRSATEELAAFSLSVDEPLNPDQAAALLQASLEFRPFKEGVTRIEPDQVDWESVATRAQEFLTPGQQRVLRSMIDRRKFEQTFRDITGLPLHFPIRGL